MAGSKYTEEFKIKVGQAALSSGKSLKAVGEEYGVHPTLVRNWRIKYAEGQEEQEENSTTIVFEFELDRGLVDENDIEDDVADLIEELKRLCVAGEFEEACNLLRASSSFEWDWSGCDADFDDIENYFGEADPIEFECDPENTPVVQVAVEDGNLIVSYVVTFSVDSPLEDVDEEELEEWLDENSCYACGYLSGGWNYSGTDGDNIRIVEIG